MLSFLSFLLFFQLGYTGFVEGEPDEVYMEIHGYENLSISPSLLESAATIAELYDRYPSDWVKDYISVEVEGICDGLQMRSKSESSQFTDEQKEILQCVDYGTEVKVDVRYIPDNSLPTNTEQKIDFALSVRPRVEASFPGGQDAMNSYLYREIKSRIPDTITPKSVKWSAVKFSIDESGHVINSEIVGTSKVVLVDNLMVEAICNMPKWTPAIDSKGVTVKQDFEFIIGNTAEMCGLNMYLIHQYFVES